MPAKISISVILASSSPYRKQQIEGLGLRCETVKPSIDESPLEDEKPKNLACRLARQKAETVARQFPTSVVIGADQVASLDGFILGKPGTEDRARFQLQQCSGNKVTFYTALCVISPNTTIERHDETRVFFRHLSSEQIEAYVKRDQPLDCAGSFKLERLGISLFEAVETEDPSALIGLPLIALTNALQELGLDVITQSLST